MDTDRVPRFDSIQMLRGLAAVLVVCVHSINVIDSAPPYWGRGWLNSALAINEFGSTGVDLFFVISGFVMAHSTAGLFGRAEAGRFLWRRFWRVVPPFWIACALFLPFAGLIGYPPTPRALANALTFVPVLDPRPYVPPPLVVGWTLAFELVFYAIVAGVMVTPMVRQREGAFIIATAGLAVAGGLEPGGFLRNPLFAEFALGVCAYSIWRRSPPRRWRVASIATGCALLIASVFTGWPFDTRLAAAVTGESGIERVLIWGVPWMLVLVGCVDLGVRRKWLAEAAKTLGDGSYAIYLSHMFVVAMAMRLVRHAPAFCGADILIVGIILSAVALGILAHRTLERPYLDWLRKRSNSWRFPRAQAVDGIRPA